MKVVSPSLLLFIIFFIGLMSGVFRSVYAQEGAVEKGREIYFSHGCALCHGKDGQGDGIIAKNYDPPPTNFYDPNEYRHGHSKDDIVYSIKHGVKDSESSIMPAFGHLSDEELEQLSSFLVSLQKSRLPLAAPHPAGQAPPTSAGQASVGGLKGEQK